jgi:hypothetical protein
MYSTESLLVRLVEKLCSATCVYIYVYIYMYSYNIYIYTVSTFILYISDIYINILFYIMIYDYI